MYSVNEIKNKIIQGDALIELKKLPEKSIQVCITSPPYYGLRDYGTANWVGGDGECDHIEIKALKRDVSGGLSWGRDKGTRGEQPHTSASNLTFKEICKKCGAIRQDQQIGLEETPEIYVQKLVEVFREVKRVLKDNGVMFLNLGDSYASNGKEGGDIDKEKGMDIERGRERLNKHKIIKPKDLIGIPWRVAFALQADGWYLRQDIIWHKPNPMPESVTDRCTKSHEYIFLLAKSQKYYFDNEAIRENVGQIITRKGTAKDKLEKRTNAGSSYCFTGSDKSGFGRDITTNGRNKRSVWTITTKPFKGAHFATFPEDLITPMVLACCPKEGIVLDPFIGSGTTGVVAKKLGRNYVGIELNKDYVKMAEERIRATPTPLF
jgi:DNA modification methylase